MADLRSKIPKLPDREQLGYKQKEFMLALNEQFQASSKPLLVVLAVVLVLAIPLKLGLQAIASRSLIASYSPPAINPNPYSPEDPQVARAGFVKVSGDIYSAYAQILNPNPEISAWEVDYEFVFTTRDGSVMSRVEDKSFVSAGESRFFVLPSVRLPSDPAEVEIEFGNIRWTERVPEFDVEFDVLQESSGVNEEGNFFVQAVVKNQRGFRIKAVKVNVLVFDRLNQSIIAVNRTEFSDLDPFEGRFFRVLWPSAIDDPGRIQISPFINPLEPGLVLEEPDMVPTR
jgi:hypothetical protein